MSNLFSGNIACFHSSGSKDIDHFREQIQQSKTTPGNANVRALMLHMWLGILQQQGADVSSFYEVNQNFLDLQNQQELAETPEPIQNEICTVIDQARVILEKIQQDFCERGTWIKAKQISKIQKSSELLTAQDSEWPTFQGNIHNTGSTEDPGPQEGSLLWKFPVGLGWYSQPVVEGGRVYCTSPGMRNICFCWDINTGNEIWRSRQIHRKFGIYEYPALSSSPLVQSRYIVLREVNSHGGNDGQAKNLVYIDKNTGEIVAKKYAGHIDYRARYAPLTGNDAVVVYPFGVHDIDCTPPICQSFNRLICKDQNNEQLIWDLNLGEIDTLAQARIADKLVLQGTVDGYLYGICLPGHPLDQEMESHILPGQHQYVRAQSKGVIAWSFHADAAINTSVCVYLDRVIFGANDGKVYCLKLQTGVCIWQKTVGNIEARARKLFSTPAVHKNSVFIGSADRHIYCLDLETGEYRWSFRTSDWIRSQAVIVSDKIFVACVDGMLYAISESGNKIWEKKISEHPIYADIKAGPGNILLNDSNLYTYCVGNNGNLLWKKSILAAFHRQDGTRIFTDQLSGGTYYQSKPVAYGGKTIFGTPSGFIFAVHAETGEELWKYEMGGAISVGPACDSGRVFAGQQGGESLFYCLNAEDGTLIWAQTLPGGWVWGSAKVDEGKVFIPTVSGYAVCLDAVTGHIIWMYRTAKSMPAEPAIYNSYVYFGSWSHSLYCFCKLTGKLIWKANGIALDSGTLITYKGRIYVPHHQNVFMSFDADTGEVLSEGNKNGDEKKNFSDFNATPAIHAGKGFFSARVGAGLVGVPLHSRVYCFDLETAELQWTFPDGGGLSAPAIAGGKVYIASGNYPFLYCLDELTGSLCWYYKLEQRVEESTLCIYKRKLYVLSADGYVHALK